LDAGGDGRGGRLEHSGRDRFRWNGWLLGLWLLALGLVGTPVGFGILLPLISRSVGRGSFVLGALQFGRFVDSRLRAALLDFIPDATELEHLFFIIYIAILGVISFDH
jgi:hypothetical protein